jgi:peroxiredoxin
VRVYQFRHIRAGRQFSRGWAAVVIAEGQAAPDCQLQSDRGETVRLADFRGTPVVLYFYPRDDMPGCKSSHLGVGRAAPVYRANG